MKSNKKGFPGEDSFVVKKGRKPGSHTNFTGSRLINGDDGSGQEAVKFRDFNTMGCAELQEQIANMNEFLTTPTFAPHDPAVVASYQNAIKTATGIYQTKGCDVKDNGYGEINQVENHPVKITNVTATDPVTKKTTIIGTVKTEVSGVTADVSKKVTAALQSETAKKAYPWLVVIGVAGLTYWMFKK